MKYWCGLCGDGMSFSTLFLRHFSPPLSRFRYTIYPFPFIWFAYIRPLQRSVATTCDCHFGLDYTTLHDVWDVRLEETTLCYFAHHYSDYVCTLRLDYGST